MLRLAVLSFSLFFWPLFVCAQSAVSEFQNGQTAEVDLSMDRELLARTNIPASWYASIDQSSRGMVYIPQGGKKKSFDRVLVVYGPGGNNLQALPEYMGFADELAAVVIAVEHSRHDTDDRGYYYYTLRMLDYLKKLGVLNERPAVVLTGFSGGSKMALCLGVYGGSRFRGVLSIGINVDLATMAYQWLPNPSALSLRMIVLNATDDPLVQGYTEAILRSMKKAGFANARHVSYQGGHAIPPEKTLECLKSLYGTMI